ncbi:hypothetical protein [Verrucomicrobium spinosum]|uniref:hypothetical protein n=1 Tax=Verrucomicrobium spinosum TaxID=2736 RepID=UPI00094661B2|nr:hypothetical protein [Verrucomicrobium spinosum]
MSGALKLGSAAVASLSAAWVEWDADAAVRWVLSLQGSLREAGLATLAVELVSEDPQYALKLALAMETGVTRNETAAFVMTQWAAGNPGEMLQWTSELNDAGLRMAAEQRLLPAIASRDPVLAATYVAEQIDQPGLQMAVVPAILQRWAQRDQWRPQHGLQVFQMQSCGLRGWTRCYGCGRSRMRERSTNGGCASLQAVFAMKRP